MTIKSNLYSPTFHRYTVVKQHLMLSSLIARTTNMNGGGCLALLDLPERTTISMDAGRSHTLRKSEELILIRDIVPFNTFHLLVVRGGLRSNASSLSAVQSEPAGLHNVGIVLLWDSPDDCPRMNSDDPAWFVARTFDKCTEELSSIPPNYATMDRLRSTFDPNRCNNPVIAYSSLVQDESDSEHDQIKQMWLHNLTHYITHEVLVTHGLTGHGDKIVPNSLIGEEEQQGQEQWSINTSSANGQGRSVDGSSFRFPSIPIIDQICRIIRDIRQRGNI